MNWKIKDFDKGETPDHDFRPYIGKTIIQRGK